VNDAIAHTHPRNIARKNRLQFPRTATNGIILRNLLVIGPHRVLIAISLAAIIPAASRFRSISDFRKVEPDSIRVLVSLKGDRRDWRFNHDRSRQASQQGEPTATRKAPKDLSL